MFAKNNGMSQVKISPGPEPYVLEEEGPVLSLFVLKFEKDPRLGSVCFRGKRPPTPATPHGDRDTHPVPQSRERASRGKEGQLYRPGPLETWGGGVPVFLGCCAHKHTPQ